MIKSQLNGSLQKWIKKGELYTAYKKLSLYLEI